MHAQGGSVMKRNAGETRRRFLAFLSASPLSLIGVRSEAQPGQLTLSSYSLGATLVAEGGQLFADKVTEKSAGTIRVSVETVAPAIPFQMISRDSALACYAVPEFANIEPVLGLSALPMLTTTFDEAETLLRIARPYYSAALARHGQILLATEPWQPTVLWSTFPIRSNADLKSILFALSSPFCERMGWGRAFIRSGARSASFFDAELVLSSGYEDYLKFTQGFAYLIDTFFAVPLNFLTASREVFDSLTEAQRHVLVDAGRDTELALWRFNREHLHRNHQDIAARGVSVAAQLPADVLATLRMASEPDIQSWIQSMGADGTAILADFRRAIGRK
jgi:TRAP-type C4-dicarboxylate transport system substrate-binding protein